jgi:hypothetical protein
LSVKHFELLYEQQAIGQHRDGKEKEERGEYDCGKKDTQNQGLAKKPGDCRQDAGHEPLCIIAVEESSPFEDQ